MSAHALPEKVRKGDPKRDRGNRTGFSTGANSAAAAAAATLGLVHGRVPDFVDCVLPNTQRVRFPITGGWTDGRRARAVSIKDAGDDPDATNGAQFYIHDPMNPLVFYLYPTPSSGWYVEAVYTAAPATTTALNDPIALDEIYVPCVLDYLCYRAYSKDAEYTANAQLAQVYYQTFTSKLTTNMQVAVAGAPADDGKVTV